MELDLGLIGAGLVFVSFLGLTMKKDVGDLIRFLDNWIDIRLYPTGTFVEAMVPNYYGIHGCNDRLFDTEQSMARAIGIIGPDSKYRRNGRVFYVLTENAGVCVVEKDLTRILRKLSKKEEFAARLKGLDFHVVRTLEESR
jgi:hypothetical protein